MVGRNGSGTSSFAEGAEVLLTGTRLLWDGRTKAWKLGWRYGHGLRRGSSLASRRKGHHRHVIPASPGAGHVEQRGRQV